MNRAMSLCNWCVCGFLFLASAGCGGVVDETSDCADGQATPSGSATAQPGDDGAAPNQDDAATDSKNAVAGQLDGLRWELPCTAPSSEYGCVTSPSPITTSVTAGGMAGTIYNVVLRFRGVIEQRTYSGGSASGLWYVGGDTPSRSDPFNVYALTISSPPQQYYLNAGTSYQNNVFGVDYTQAVQIAAGATVTLTADAIEGTEIMNIDPTGTPIVIPGIAPAPAAFNGQFLQMDVMSVTPH